MAEPETEGSEGPSIVPGPKSRSGKSIQVRRACGTDMEGGREGERKFPPWARAYDLLKSQLF
jgi:hypothetical protein